MQEQHFLKSERAKIILAFAAIYIIWGSTYFFNKLLVLEVPPFLSAGVRFICASLLIFAIAKFMKIPFDTTKTRVLNAGFAGVLMLTFGNGAVVWALQFVDSGVTALIVSSQPLMLLFLLFVLERKKISMRSLFGVFLGILGIYLLTSEEGIVRTDDYIKGVFVIFIAILTWAYGSIFVAKSELPRNHFINSGVQMLFAGVFLMLASLLFGEDWSAIARMSVKAKFSLLYLVLFGSIVAFTAFNYLLKKVSTEKVTTNTYVNPVVALFMGWAFLAEPITPRALLASFVLLVGVFVINTRKS